jgi:hypothetical protein
MQSKADQFRAHAAECQKKAKAINDPAAKEAFLEVARHWLLMAEQAERQGR